ncbi:UNVERIFIED_CONTAM: Vesicle-associated protein 1-1 [Sesamum latifolium]|uniref:Vesicle-associated protein 1-1 n=1 Tax=Sesamum latifolium TaxID=2727402 RepID=A0AAW2XWK7_9LAMI
MDLIIFKEFLTRTSYTVTMQAQKSAPSEMQCKDKFLIQSTVVPFGTTEEEITSSMFAKESQKYIEETKLRVVLTSAPSSPAKPDIAFKQESYENLVPKGPQSPVLLPVNGVIKQEPSYETSMPKDKLQNGVENFPPPDMLTEKAEPINNVNNLEEYRSLKVMESLKSVPAKDEEFYPDKHEESKQLEDAGDAELKLTENIEELRSKISALNSKLVEAENTIEKLKEETSNTIREKETIKQELFDDWVLVLSLVCGFDVNNRKVIEYASYVITYKEMGI